MPRLAIEVDELNFVSKPRGDGSVGLEIETILIVGMDRQRPDVEMTDVGCIAKYDTPMKFGFINCKISIAY